MDPNQQPNPQNSNGPGSTTGPSSAPGGPLPGVYTSPSLEPMPYNTQSALQPQAASGVSPQFPAKSGPSKLVMVVIAGVVLLVVLGIIVALSNSGKKPANQAQQTQETGQSVNLKPAQAIDLQQASNAIGHDLSTLDDEKNYPANSLDDKTLGL